MIAPEFAAMSDEDALLYVQALSNGGQNALGRPNKAVLRTYERKDDPSHELIDFIRSEIEDVTPEISPEN